MAKKSDLPFGSEFSPSQIDLAKVLELAAQHEGDRTAFNAAIHAEYFGTDRYKDTSEAQQHELAKNTYLGARAYGIIDEETGALTGFGKILYGLRKKPKNLYEALARHILLNLHGSTLVQCIQDMQSAGTKITLPKLSKWLGERGLYFPPSGRHASTMRLWLALAGVFVGKGWEVDEEVLAKIRGIDSDGFEALSELNAEQRAYLRALVNTGSDGPHMSNEIAQLATATYGVTFNAKSLPRMVLTALQDGGFITLKRTTKHKGRGAKPWQVFLTDKLKKEIGDPLLKQLDKQVRPELRKFLRVPLAEVLEDVDAKDRHKRGLALEALAIRLMRILDLQYVATRYRNVKTTGGAEVDLIFEGTRLVFSRWQIQCKNTASVGLHAVAKEVGLIPVLKSNVILVVTTGKVGSEAKRYATTIMRDTNLCIVFLEGPDLRIIAKRPAHIAEALGKQAKQIMTIKRLDEYRGDSV